MLRGPPGCLRAQPAQALPPHQSMPSRSKMGCDRGQPWLAGLSGLSDSIFCHEPCQEAGTGQARGSRTAPDTGLRGVSYESWAAGPQPAEQTGERAKSRHWLMFPSCRPSPRIRACAQGERPASRARVTSGQHGSRGKLASIAEPWPTLKLPYCSHEETATLRGRASAVGGVAGPGSTSRAFTTLCVCPPRSLV